jgi:hypothetical protein
MDRERIQTKLPVNKERAIKNMVEKTVLLTMCPDERPVKEILNQSKTINLIEAFKL